MLFTRTLPLSLTRHNQLFRSEITYFTLISPVRSSRTHYKTGWDLNNNRQPLLHVKYDTITIIKSWLTPWQDVAIQVFSADGEGESQPLLVISQPLQVISPPLLPHYIREDTWSPHNRWHMSNIITIASWQNTFIFFFLLTCLPRSGSSFYKYTIETH